MALIDLTNLVGQPPVLRPMVVVSVTAAIEVDVPGWGGKVVGEEKNADVLVAREKASATRTMGLRANEGLILATAWGIHVVFYSQWRQAATQPIYSIH